MLFLLVMGFSEGVFFLGHHLGLLVVVGGMLEGFAAGLVVGVEDAFYAILCGFDVVLDSEDLEHLYDGLGDDLGLFFIDLAVNVGFFLIAFLYGHNDILNMLKDRNNIGLVPFQIIFLGKQFPIFLILQQFIGYNKRLILPFVDRLDDFLFRVFNKVLKVEFLDLVEDGVVELELLLLLCEK